MQEISEMQAFNRKEFALLAVHKFKHLIFRYRVLHKLHQLTKLTKDSLDFRCLKTQLMDLLLSTSHPHLGQTLARAQGDLCELRFKHRNLERKY
jgi:hypothetical protein